MNPIETAPTDGTRIMVFVPAHEYDDPSDPYVSCVRGWFTAWHDGGTWYTGLRDTTDSYGALDQPSHWMTIPDDDDDSQFDEEIAEIAAIHEIGWDEG